MPQITRKMQLTGHNAAVYALAATGDGRHFLSGSGDGWIVRWDLEAPETGQLIARVEGQIFSLCYLPERSVVVVGNMHGGVHWVNLEDPRQTLNIAHHKKGTFAILRVRDRVYTAGGDGMLTRWDAATGRSLESIQLSYQALRSLDYHPQRQEIAVGSSDQGIYLVDEHSLAIRHRWLVAHQSSVFSVRYGPHGQVLFSGGRDALLRKWDLTSKEALLEQPAHWFTINTIAFDPTGHWFATGSRDKTIKIWKATTGELVKVLDTIRDGCHVNSVNTLLWMDNGKTLISASDDRSLILWHFQASDQH